MKTSEKREVEIIATEVVEAFTVQLRSDGIVHSHTSADKEFNVESLKKFNDVMGRMTNYKKAPLLISFDTFAIPPVPAREFWAKKESAPYVSADAYLTHSMGHKLIGNFYLKLNKPGRPTKMFNHIEDAIEWLRTFL